MNDKAIIELKKLNKTYKLYTHKNDLLKETIFKKKYHSLHEALKDISFKIYPKEAVGIIGVNGSGKSTILKILAGIMKPTSGEITVEGRVSAILELGAGFNPENTGIENVRFNCMLIGMSDNEINNKLQEIIEFADIGEYIYQPVKTYSSGMVARLAFATAINVDPDILIVDEALSVGDMYFQTKSIAKMRELMEYKTVLFVSHDMDVIRSFCNRAIYLKDGRVYMDGNVKQVTETYETENNKRIADLKKTISLKNMIKNPKEKDSEIEISNEIDLEFKERTKIFKSGTGEVEFIRADMFVKGEKTNTIPFGATCILKIVAVCNEDVPKGATIGYTVRNKAGLDVFGLNIYNEAKLLPQLKKGQTLYFDIKFKNVLAPGKGYTVGLGLKPTLHNSTFMDAIYSAIIFDVPTLEDSNWVPGIVYVDQEMDVNIK